MKIDINIENSSNSNSSDPNSGPKAGASVDADAGFEQETNPCQEDSGKTDTGPDLS
jgi:hypothetical protein